MLTELLLHTNDMERAELLNNYFCSVCTDDDGITPDFKRDVCRQGNNKNKIRCHDSISGNAYTGFHVCGQSLGFIRCLLYTLYYFVHFTKVILVLFCWFFYAWECSYAAVSSTDFTNNFEHVHYTLHIHVHIHAVMRTGLPHETNLSHASYWTYFEFTSALADIETRPVPPWLSIW